MNSIKCKLLRRMIYGDLSHRIERSYITVGHTVSKMVPDKSGIMVRKHFTVNQTINDPESPRGKYLAAKRNYKANKRKG